MQKTEPVFLSHDCQVIQIPNGQPTRLVAGTAVRVVQSQGTSYTIATEHGVMFRLNAGDGDAIGLPTLAVEDAPRADVFQEELLWKQLKTVYDPEIPVNIVDLGLIYSADVAPLESGGKRIDVKMSMTAPGCGMANVMKGDVEKKLAQLPEVKEVHVHVVFDPPWNPGMMSEAARLQLGFELDYGASSSNLSTFKIIR